MAWSPTEIFNYWSGALLYNWWIWRENNWTSLNEVSLLANSSLVRRSKAGIFQNFLPVFLLCTAIANDVHCEPVQIRFNNRLLAFLSRLLSQIFSVRLQRYYKLWFLGIGRAIGDHICTERKRADMEGSQKDEVHLACPARNDTVATAAASWISWSHRRHWVWRVHHSQRLEGKWTTWTYISFVQQIGGIPRLCSHIEGTLQTSTPALVCRALCWWMSQKLAPTIISM